MPQINRMVQDVANQGNVNATQRFQAQLQVRPGNCSSSNGPGGPADIGLWACYAGGMDIWSRSAVAAA